MYGSSVFSNISQQSVLIRISLILLLLQPLYCISQTDKTQMQELDSLLSIDSVATIIDGLPFTKPKAMHNFKGIFSTSYTSSDNLQAETFNVISLASKLNYSYSREGYVWSSTHRISIDIAYMKYVDSLWYKSNDVTNLNFLWVENNEAAQNSLLLKVKTQLTPTYDYIDEKGYEKELRSNFLNPFSMEFGYGMNWDFWEESNLNIAFATIKVSSKPNYDDTVEEEKKEFTRTKNSVLGMEYGFSGQLYISKHLLQSVAWENSSSLFFNELNEDHVFVDITNSLRYELYSNVELSFNSSVGYDPETNYKRQLNHVLMVGVFFKM